MKTIRSIFFIILLALFPLISQAQPWSIDSIKRINHEFTAQAGVFLQQSTVSGFRDGFFLHGLGGKPESWNETALKLESDYYLKQHVADYRNWTNTDLVGAGKSVSDWIQQKNSTLEGPPSKAIAIAHSQGGMVAKAMEYTAINDPVLYPRRFGGLVTFGTPHGGAMILNNGDPKGTKKLIQAFVNDGCQKFARSEINNLIASNWWVGTLTSMLNIDEILNTTIPEATCGAFANTLIPLLMDDLATDITTDYNVGSPMVNTLNNMNSSIPVVTFYGEEEQPVFYRTISSFTIESRDITATDPYTAGDDDSKYISSANSMMSHYYTRYQVSLQHKRWHAKQYRTYSRLAWLFPPLAFKASHHWEQARRKANNADAAFGAYKWLHNANDNWLEIIGAKWDSVYNAAPANECRCTYTYSNGQSLGTAQHPIIHEFSTVSNGVCHYFSGNVTVKREVVASAYPHYDCLVKYYQINGNYVEYLGTRWESNQGCLTTTFTANKNCANKVDYRIIEITDPNDGVVTAQSATDYPQAVARWKMKNTNHQQMRNCTETKRAFEDLFGGDIPNTDFFHTDNR